MRACVVPSARAERAAQRELLQPWRAQAYVHGLLVEPELVRDGCHGDAGCARTQALCGSKNEGRKEEEAAPAAARHADFVLEACFARAVTDPTLTFRDQRACCAPNLHMHNQELSKETLSCHISLKFSNSKSRYIGYTSHLQKAAAVRLRLTCVVQLVVQPGQNNRARRSLSVWLPIPNAARRLVGSPTEAARPFAHASWAPTLSRDNHPLGAGPGGSRAVPGGRDPRRGRARSVSDISARSSTCRDGALASEPAGRQQYE